MTVSRLLLCGKKATVHEEYNVFKTQQTQMNAKQLISLRTRSQGLVQSGPAGRALYISVAYCHSREYLMS